MVLVENESRRKDWVHEFTRTVLRAKSSLRCSNFVRLQTGVGSKKIHLIAAKAIQKNFYMDNFAKSVATVGEAVQLQTNVQITLKMGDSTD